MTATIGQTRLALVAVFTIVAADLALGHAAVAALFLKVIAVTATAATASTSAAATTSLTLSVSGARLALVAVPRVAADFALGHAVLAAELLAVAAAAGRAPGADLADGAASVGDAPFARLAVGALARVAAGAGQGDAATVAPLFGRVAVVAGKAEVEGLRAEAGKEEALLGGLEGVEVAKLCRGSSNTC